MPIQALLLRTFLPAVILVAIALAIIVYNLLYTTILDGFEKKLVATSALAGAMIDPHDHDRLLALAVAQADAATIEAGELYQRNVAPLRRIRSELGLTYLYTQVVGGPEDVLYVLDGSPGDDHSPIGSADDLPADTLAGLRRVEREGAIHVSPVQYQEQWGLLKTVAAPVHGADGRVAASAGADVDISVIQVATQNALFGSAVIGAGSLIVCLIVALALVRRIARPIAGLTDDALRLAAGAGAGADAPAGPEPREVAELRAAFGRLATWMKAEARARDKAIAQHGQASAEAVLRSTAGPDAGAPVILVDTDDLRVAWLPAPGADGILARQAMAGLAARMSLMPELARSWANLADRQHGGCLMLDLASGQARWDGAARLCLRNGERTSTIEPGGQLPIDRGPPIAAALSGSNMSVLWPGVEP